MFHFIKMFLIRTFNPHRFVMLVRKYNACDIPERKAELAKLIDEYFVGM